MVLVYNNWSKTNQFMNREIVIPLCQNSTRALDPVIHLKSLLEWEIGLDKPAFSFMDGGKLSCVTYDIFTRRLKSLLDRIGKVRISMNHILSDSEFSLTFMSGEIK